LLFVGSCNRALPYFASANGKGIAAFRVDDETGAVEALGVTEGIDNPTFLATSADGRTLCATSEVLGWNEGTITAYALDRETGSLTYLAKQPTRGDIAAHLSFDATGSYVANVNYSVGPTTGRPNRSVVVYPLAADGEIGPPAAEVSHPGKGSDPARQDRSHAHCVRWTPDNRFVVVCDLGLDKLVIYAFDEATGSLTPHGELVMPPASGPRHFAFHPTLPFAYAVNEMASTLASLSFDAAAGSFKLLGLEATVPAEVLGRSHCSAIKIAPGGKHLFVGNRGEDSIARFNIDPESGMATRTGATPAGGKIPRDFAFDPSGKYLAVANQDSDVVTLFRYDPTTGALTPFGSPISTGTPTAIAFVAL
jgi:6-phosphogluconolactonase